MLFASLLNGFLVVLVIWAAGSMLRHGRSRKAQRTTRELLVSPMSGLVAGAMLLGFQSLVQPEVRHRIVVEQKEEALEDADGNPPPGGRLFHEQLRKIRRGEDIDGLTIQIKP